MMYTHKIYLRKMFFQYKQQNERVFIRTGARTIRAELSDVEALYDELCANLLRRNFSVINLDYVRDQRSKTVLLCLLGIILQEIPVTIEKMPFYDLPPWDTLSENP